jgi:hypothetical protein
MNAGTLRLIWNVIEDAHIDQWLGLTDKALVTRLVQQISGQAPLSTEEVGEVSDYIRSKTMLIRDLREPNV